MRSIGLIVLIALVMGAVPVKAGQDATPAVTAQVPAAGAFAGLVDIGGRSIYLECRGTGSPTVILIGGYRSSARYWTDDLRPFATPRTMVLPGVARTTRVCAYDRPGTAASIGDQDYISRSDPVAQPRSSLEVVEELHALLQAAGLRGPYILAGHSLGGFFARHYAATYPEEVAGLVLIDAYSEMLEDQMPPDRWQALVRLNQGMGTDAVIPIPGYGDLETLPWGADNAVVRAAVTEHPLPPMPLAVLSHGKPFAMPPDAQGFTTAELEGYLQAANESAATLVPHARFWVASESGHDIHQDQPALVVAAIEQVIAGVRNPDTWYDLRFCCEN